MTAETLICWDNYGFYYSNFDTALNLDWDKSFGQNGNRHRILAVFTAITILKGKGFMTKSLHLSNLPFVVKVWDLVQLLLWDLSTFNQITDQKQEKSF